MNWQSVSPRKAIFASLDHSKKELAIINQMSGGIYSPYLPVFPAHYFFIRFITSRFETWALTHKGLEGGKLSDAVRPIWTD